MKSKIAIVVGLLSASAGLHAEQYPFDNDAWQIQAEESSIVDYLGQRALLMKGGSALLDGVEMTDGVIGARYRPPAGQGPTKVKTPPGMERFARSV